MVKETHARAVFMSSYGPQKAKKIAHFTVDTYVHIFYVLIDARKALFNSILNGNEHNYYMYHLPVRLIIYH